MRIFCAILFVVSSCSALSLQQLLLVDDGTGIIDNIVYTIQKQTPSSLRVPDVNLDLVFPNSSIEGKLGSIKAVDGWLREATNFLRIGPVAAVPSLGNLTLSSKFSFWGLSMQYRVTLEVLGTETNTQLNVTFDQNEFDLILTVYSDPSNGRCAVDLKKAAFTNVRGVRVNGSPLGYFNQITLNAYIDHITQSVLNQIRYGSIINIQEVAQTAICKDS